MVAHYNFEEKLDDFKASIKTAFHSLLIEYGNKGERKGEYILDVDQFDFSKSFPCHKIIRNGVNICFEEYGDDTIDLYNFDLYPVSFLAEFYDKLAKAIDNQEK